MNYKTLSTEALEALENAPNEPREVRIAACEELNTRFIERHVEAEKLKYQSK